MTYTVISTLQIFSAIIISVVLSLYFRHYQRQYLKYWAKSFACLTVFLVTGLVLSTLAKQGFAYHLVGMYILSTLKLLAGFLQILWLILGCYELAKPQQNPFKYDKQLVILASVTAIFFASLYAFDPEGGLMRHMIRTSARYIIGGSFFILAGIYLLKRIETATAGRNLVIISFGVLGLEMALLGAASLTQQWALIGEVVRYHGALELLAYSTIGLGLVMWLLEFERAKRQEIHLRLNSLGQHDILTGLINRQGFEQFIKRWQSGEKGNEEDVFVVLFGVDKFKRINEAGGIKLGDDVLSAIASHFKRFPNTAVAKARLSGDVFACLLSANQASQENLNNIRKTIARSIKLPNHNLHIELSCGAARVTQTESSETIMLNAQRALQQSKLAGGKRTTIFSELTPEKRDSIEFENELRNALKNKEFRLFLQPIYDGQGEQILGFEALVRWQHPTRGVLAPIEFIPFLLQLQLMPKLDMWVLEEAAHIIQNWQNHYSYTQSIAVNLSAEGLNNTEYLACARNVLKQLGKHVDKLHIEITETSAMKSISSGQFAIAQLSEMGVKISLDDFGSGYSSLNYLKSFPADKIKFDHGFIKEMIEDDNTEKILSALVPLCQQLGKKVVAEGIETRQHLQMAQTIGFDQMQGYLFAKPMPVNDAFDLLNISENLAISETQLLAKG